LAGKALELAAGRGRNARRFLASTTGTGDRGVIRLGICLGCSHPGAPLSGCQLKSSSRDQIPGQLAVPHPHPRLRVHPSSQMARPHIGARCRQRAWWGCPPGACGVQRSWGEGPLNSKGCRCRCKARDVCFAALAQSLLVLHGVFVSVCWSCHRQLNLLGPLCLFCSTAAVLVASSRMLDYLGRRKRRLADKKVKYHVDNNATAMNPAEYIIRDFKKMEKKL